KREHGAAWTGAPLTHALAVAGSLAFQWEGFPWRYPVKDAARRYSPAEVEAVSREVESGLPSNISTSYVERQNLTLRMTQRRFARLTNGFSKKLDHHAAAVSLYVAHYNLCRVHEALRTTPAVTLGIADRVWTIGDLIDAALPLEPN